MIALRLALLLTTTMSFAQSGLDLFTKAPPAVDEALRDRVVKFYQAQTEGKFRIANQYVAEESKDVFYEADKRRCRKLTIARINYEQDFTNANVVSNCDTDMLMPPAGLMKVTIPLSTFWKVINGEWFWYVPNRETTKTAFGSMKAGPGDGDSGTTIPRGPSVQDLMRMVAVDKNELTMPVEGKGSGTIVVSSAMPGRVDLILEPVRAAGLTAKLDKIELAGGESAKLTVEYAGGAGRTAGSVEEIRLVAKPVNRTFVIKVVFQ